MSKQTETRGKIKPRPAQHRAICLVCNHPQKEDIERRYLAFETCEKLAAEFGLSDDSISRHGLYFGLDERRVGDTEKLLKIVVARGFQQFSNNGISEKAWIECLKELNKITGKRTEPAKNPTDIEKAKEILEWHRTVNGRCPTQPDGFSDYQIYEYVLKPIFPNLTPEQLEIKVEVKGDEE